MNHGNCGQHLKLTPSTRSPRKTFAGFSVVLLTISLRGLSWGSPPVTNKPQHWCSDILVGLCPDVKFWDFLWGSVWPRKWHCWGDCSSVWGSLWEEWDWGGEGGFPSHPLTRKEVQVPRTFLTRYNILDSWVPSSWDSMDFCVFGSHTQETHSLFTTWCSGFTLTMLGEPVVSRGTPSTGEWALILHAKHMLTLWTSSRVPIYTGFYLSINYKVSEIYLGRGEFSHTPSISIWSVKIYLDNIYVLILPWPSLNRTLQMNSYPKDKTE